MSLPSDQRIKTIYRLKHSQKEVIKYRKSKHMNWNSSNTSNGKKAKDIDKKNYSNSDDI